VPVAAALNIAPVKVVHAQNVGASPTTEPDAKNPQASSGAPPNPIVSEKLAKVVVVLVVLVVVVVEAAVVVVVVVLVLAPHGVNPII